MKKLLLLLIVIIDSCSPSTMITGSWKSPSFKTKNYKNILVAALTDHAVAKSTVENDMTEMLAKQQIKASKSIELFPIKMSNSESDRESLMRKIQNKKIDALLTISLLKKETESHYLDNSALYDPVSHYGYYNNFWEYYSFWYPITYNNDYYTETIYYIETNLYDAKTENLVWSIQSKTYDQLELPSFSKEFAKIIVDKLKKDGILKPEVHASNSVWNQM
ncbi:MAG TPA: hypothetical protein VK590_01120 [Saprospiraceae bacterium]|nr:hypothetical protein [Saprospiraceae bacterium]